MAVIKVGNNNIGKISVIEPYDDLIKASSEPKFSSSIPDVWQRPSGWLDMPTLTNNKVHILMYVPSGYKDFGIGLFARNGVYNNCPTHISIDWGDGHSGIFYGTRSDNVNYSGNFGNKHKKYDYDLLPPSTEIEVNNFPCRQVLIRLDGTASGITYFSLSRMSGERFGDSSDYGEADHYYDENNVKVYDTYRNDSSRNYQTIPILDVMASGSEIDDFYISATNGQYGKARNIQRVVANVKSFNPNYKFHDCENLQHVEFPSGATTGKTDFYRMFATCVKMKNLPFFDTSSATGVEQIFSNNHRVKSIPNYNFSNVTNFDYIFHRMHSLEEIPNIDFSNGTRFRHGFSYNYTLKTLPSGFNISSATGCRDMFYFNYNLRAIPSLSCPNLTDGENMFYHCSSLSDTVTIDFPSINIARSFMYGNSRIKKLVIKNFGGGSVRDYYRTFRSMNSLKEIQWETCDADTVNATGMYETFTSNMAITRYPININTSSVINIDRIFNYNYQLIEAPTLDLTSCTTARRIFEYCYNLTDVNFKNVNNKPNMEFAFTHCYNLRVGPSGLFEDYNSTPVYVQSMFSECYYLEDVSNYIISGITSTSTNNNRMFYNCQRLDKPPKIINTQGGLRNAFESCSALESVDYDLSTSEDNTNMFYRTNGLKNVNISGVKSSISFYDTFLGSGEMIKIINSLETVGSNRTVDFRYCYGASQLDSATIAIATNKGWTVTT